MPPIAAPAPIPANNASTTSPLAFQGPGKQKSNRRPLLPAALRPCVDALGYIAGFITRFLGEVLVALSVLVCVATLLASAQPTEWPFNLLVHGWQYYTLALLLIALISLFRLRRLWCLGTLAVLCLVFLCWPQLQPYTTVKLPSLLAQKTEPNKTEALALVAQPLAPTVEQQIAPVETASKANKSAKVASKPAAKTGQGDAPINAPADSHDFQVLQFNLWKFNPDPEAAIATINNSGAVLVSLNEVEGQWPDQLTGSPLMRQYPHQVRYARDTWLLSQWPVESYKRHFLLYPQEDPSMDALLEAAIRTPDGKRLWVLATHTANPVKEGGLRRQLRLLRMLARRSSELQQQGQTVLVMGDFNITPWDTTHAELLTKGQLRQPRNALRTLAGTWGFLVPTPGLALPVDQILLSGPLQASELKPLPYAGSDHAPLQARLHWKDTASSELSASATQGSPSA